MGCFFLFVNLKGEFHELVINICLFHAVIRTKFAADLWGAIFVPINVICIKQILYKDIKEFYNGIN